MRLGTNILDGGYSARVEQALRWKNQGGKVIGTLCPYVPEEIIHAAGMLPWRIFGTRDADLSASLAYRGPSQNAFANHVAAAMLSGELDFLDGIVLTDWDFDFLRLWDLFDYRSAIPFKFLLHVPHLSSPSACASFAQEVEALAQKIGAFGNVHISDALLARSITICNRTRRLFQRLYKLRKGSSPSVTGRQALEIASAGLAAPREEFHQALAAFLGQLEQDSRPAAMRAPRILLTSDFLHDISFLDLIERAGCVVVVDDLDVTMRHLWQEVEEHGDPMLALANWYLSRPTDPRMSAWDRQIETILGWVAEYRVDGVLELALLNCRPREMRSRLLIDALKDAGIPCASFPRQYLLTDAGQLSTRVGAFLELLEH